MKKLRIILTLVISFAFLACSRTETNGALGGNWQMTEWKQIRNDSLIATQNDVQLHYTIHRDLLKCQNFTQSNEYYLATFHRTADSLVIENIYHSPIDTLVRFDELSIVGIDGTGRFRIEQLTNEKMILLNTAYQLTFRKY
ncbi:MAG: lipocalin-like domain-containing protein [Bacteroidaceae bacterium]|nr:lipocalin-like domain-containing protein [Bacteroidaceae bacterium]